MSNKTCDYRDDEHLAYSILRLYNNAFRFCFPLVLIVFIIQLFFGEKAENSAILIGLLVTILFFKLFGNQNIIRKHQLSFHKFFVFTIVAICAVYFIVSPAISSLIYLLFIGSVACFLMIELRAIVSYFLVYHIFLFSLSFYFPILKVEFIIYSLVFSTASIFVGKWLQELFETSRKNESITRKYRSLFENGNSAIFLLKRQADKFVIFDSNANCEKLFGVNRQDLMNKELRILSSESDENKENMCDVLINMKQNDRMDIECKFIRKNEGEFLTETSFVPLVINNEVIIQALITDISEKRKNEKKLSETIQSFKNIVDNSPVGMFIFVENELVYKNADAERLYNEELNNTKTNIFDIFPKKQKYVLEELLGEVSNKISSYTEILLGGAKRFSFSLVKVVYNGQNATLLVLLDITLQNEYNIQRIRAEIAEDLNEKLSEEIEKHHDTQTDLIEKTSQLNALFESSSNLFILTINRDLNIASFNSSFKKMMFEYLGVEVKLGDDFLNTFPIEEAAYGKLINRFKRAFRGESVQIVSHFPTKKGEIWVESFISPVKVEGQPIKEIAFIAHSITEKVENERKILDSEANNKATVSAIPDMLFKVNKKGFFTDFRLNEEGEALLKDFAYTTDLLNMHVNEVFKDKKQTRIFFHNIEKSLRTGIVHKQNFIVPFIIGKTDKKRVFENRYSRVNSDEVIVITRDVTDKVEFETRLIESVKEKEILLKEVHHRVKNNLQVISSILNLQSSYVEDEKTLEIINESQNRIRSMSYIHESLYQTKDFSSIDFHDYITNLVQNLVHSYQLYSGKTKLKLDLDRLQLVLDQAIPCGLILNELVSNSLKHAYPGEEGGEIHIEIKEEDGKIKIRVEDFGQGLPEGFKIEDSDSLGLGLVDTLVDQIDGELILKTENGTKYLIIFEKQDL